MAENAERYLSYAEKYKKLTKTEVVRYVNLGFDKPFYTDIQDSPNKDNYLVLVNKYYNLGADFVPKDLMALPKEYKSTSYSVELAGDAYYAFIEMADAAAAEGYSIKGQSGYRDYDKQQRLYEKYLKNENGNTLLHFQLLEGRNRQIRRMCEAVGLKILRLTRVAIGTVTLGNLKEGTYRHLTENEVNYLMHNEKAP